MAVDAPPAPALRVGSRSPRSVPRRSTRYKARQLREGRLGANQINKTLGTLARILEDAADYGLVYGRNPARGFASACQGDAPPSGCPRSGAAPRPSRRGEVARSGRCSRRLVGAGLRNGEACALDWRRRQPRQRNDQRRGPRRPTPASGSSTCPWRFARSSGTTRRGSARAAPEDPVFTNRNGDRQTVSNVERRLKTTIRRANVRLAALGLEPISAAGHAALAPAPLREPAIRAPRRPSLCRRAGRMDRPGIRLEGLRAVPPGAAIGSPARRSRQFDLAIDWAAMGRIEPEEPSHGPRAAAGRPRRNAATAP